MILAKVGPTHIPWYCAQNDMNRDGCGPSSRCSHGGKIPTVAFYYDDDPGETEQSVSRLEGGEAEMVIIFLQILVLLKLPRKWRYFGGRTLHCFINSKIRIMPWWKLSTGITRRGVIETTV
jgi:hypothetical protein